MVTSFVLPVCFKNLSSLLNAKTTYTIIITYLIFSDHPQKQNLFIYGWGSNKYGQILPKGGPQWISKPVNMWEGHVITKVRCGRYHTIALDENGKAYSIGFNKHGQLGSKLAVPGSVSSMIQTTGDFVVCV